MCLYRVNERLAGRGTKVYTGWKVFATVTFRSVVPVTHKYSFRYFNHAGKAEVPVNRWLKASYGHIGSGMGTGDGYDAGFHIYADSYTAEHSARYWDHLVAVKVKYRGVVARGSEASQRVVVAKEMYVPYRKPRRTRNVNKAKK